MKKISKGQTPSIALINPKFPHNVGAAIRAASCFGVKQVFFTGVRIDEELRLSKRLPREERMKGYKDVELLKDEYFFDRFDKDVIPIAVEITPTSELLTFFEHPEKALYVFGPEDGSIPQVVMRHCHRFVSIPSAHCLNLAAAVNVVLSDRRMKRQRLGLEEVLPACEMLNEDRGLIAVENKIPEFIFND